MGKNGYFAVQMWKNAKFCKEVQNKKYERQKNNCRGFYRRNNMTDEEYYEFIQPYEDAKQMLLTRLDVLNHNLYGERNR